MKNQFNRALFMKHHLETDKVSIRASPHCVASIIIVLVILAVLVA